MNVKIQEIKKEDHAQAMQLVWKVFQAFVACDYEKEGIQEFYTSIQDEHFLNSLTCYGAYEQDTCIGVIATRNHHTHIALFFVDGQQHRRGIGKALFQHILSRCSSKKITVNASPYALKFYHMLGFVDTDKEQQVHGLRFTPMEYERKV